MTNCSQQSNYFDSVNTIIMLQFFGMPAEFNSKFNLSKLFTVSRLMTNVFYDRYIYLIYLTIISMKGKKNKSSHYWWTYIKYYKKVGAPVKSLKGQESFCYWNFLKPYVYVLFNILYTISKFHDSKILCLSTIRTV